MSISEPKRDAAATRSVPPSVQQTLLEQRRTFLRFLERLLGRHDLAEELLQEAYAKALPQVGRLRDPDAATAWFYRTLRNAVIDHHRRSQASERALERLGAEVETGATSAEPSDGQPCRCVLRVSEELRPNYATALQRIEVEGISVKAFASEQGISDNNAAARISRARRALRKRIEETCGACAQLGCTDCSCATGSTGGDRTADPADPCGTVRAP